jgi:hypothetical protein
MPIGGASDFTKRNLEINDYNFNCKKQNFSHNGHMRLQIRLHKILGNIFLIIKF